MNEYTNCGVYTMEYYSAIKRNAPILSTTWMNLEGIRPSERRFHAHDTAENTQVQGWKTNGCQGWGGTAVKNGTPTS